MSNYSVILQLGVPLQFNGTQIQMYRVLKLILIIYNRLPLTTCHSICVTETPMQRVRRFYASYNTHSHQ